VALGVSVNEIGTVSDGKPPGPALAGFAAASVIVDVSEAPVNELPVIGRFL
jgi:hypothetical protein